MTATPFIFTDLDGTLLDHFDYSFSAAAAMLKLLQERNIAVIPNTSKTAAELKEIRQQLNLDTPFIVENGAAIYIPKGFLPKRPLQTDAIGDYWVHSFVRPRAHWINMVKTATQELSDCFKPMSDMSIEEIVSLTGLTEEQAQLAATREFGEPVVWYGTQPQKQIFIKRLTEAGATVLEGGRFLHVSGNCNKAKSMFWLLRQVRMQSPQLDPFSIALGDGQNDSAMLNGADYAGAIKSPVHPFPALTRTTNLWLSTKHGPAGWTEVLSDMLQLTPNETKDKSYG